MAEKVLTITGCVVGKEGVALNGRAWTRFDLEAVNVSGAPVGERLWSWERVPIGERAIFDVTLVPVAGKATYQVARKPGGHPNGHDAAIVRAASVEERVDQLERDLQAIQVILEGLAP